MSIQEMFPYLRVRDAARAIAFYAQAFGATERMRLVEPGGRIGHAELELGPGVLMLSEAYPELGLHAPEDERTLGASIHLHVDDCDAVTERAVASGATLQMAPTDQFYGERSSRVLDPFGHQWMIGHEIEKVSVDEMQRRYDALFAGDG